MLDKSKEISIKPSRSLQEAIPKKVAYKVAAVDPQEAELLLNKAFDLLFESTYQANKTINGK